MAAMTSVTRPPVGVSSSPTNLQLGRAIDEAAAQPIRSPHPALEILSPVNQKGHFEFDRVLKSGQVLKRTRKTKQWRSVHLVLRPGVLSIYRGPDETKLRHKIVLSDLTAIARQRDPKGRAKHVFGLFSPSRNFHLNAKNDVEAQDWVELISREARIDEDEEDMQVTSPSGRNGVPYTGHGRRQADIPNRPRAGDGANISSSDAEPYPGSSPTRSAPVHNISELRRPSATMDYSGPENASYSDFSDAMGPSARLSVLSLSRPPVLEEGSVEEAVEGDAQDVEVDDPHERDQAQARASAAQLQEAARIVCQGWALLLKTKSGMRQWKKTWMVLRPGSLAMYKNERESAALMIIPFPDILDVVEIDPISSSKRYCMQIITEDRGYRFCAPDEDSLTKWLGAFKSLLVRRRGDAQHS